MTLKSLMEFVQAFFELSDGPSRNEDWVSSFTPDAKVAIGRDAAEGREDIRAMRLGMWENVASRRHTVERVDIDGATGDNALQVQLAGNVKYTLKKKKKKKKEEANEEGGKEEEVVRVVEWTATGRAVEDEGKWRWKEYRVVLGSC
ncbi:hypothetical protein QBC35DRAFT_437042 [Podospora australis]|uniref:SnoaL-like domain-containing protein n=1 Tax=Podospora australis TaxID=1536484 RepID=A0AAN7AGN8_9PEZI|nr:hypothetical protein QBC35DRAFT_437042 [Podospora australis]